jgi:hypothetical protein
MSNGETSDVKRRTEQMGLTIRVVLLLLSAGMLVLTLLFKTPPLITNIALILAGSMAAVTASTPLAVYLA